MTATNEERRPGPNQSGVMRNGSTHLGSILPPSTPLLSDLDALAEHLRGYFVVQVVVSDAGQRRTYIYRTTLAAERAVERARECGRHASIALCQLMPVGVVFGGAK